MTRIKRLIVVLTLVVAMLGITGATGSHAQASVRWCPFIAFDSTHYYEICIPIL